MQIYALTPLGKRLARSINNPDSSGYRIIHFLDQQGHADTTQIAEFCGLSVSEASSMLRRLSRGKPKVVTEVGGVRI